VEFVSIRVITADVDRLVGFYSRLLGRDLERPHPLFAQLRGPSGTLAVSGDATVAAMGAGVAEAASNRSVIIEFRVEDVDATFDGLRPWVEDVVMEPRTMPWGNRSLLLRDPDGNLVNLFAPAPAP
jgi:predicted enzyme related to lactoylglutathione lyase